MNSKIIKLNLNVLKCLMYICNYLVFLVSKCRYILSELEATLFILIFRHSCTQGRSFEIFVRDRGRHD